MSHLAHTVKLKQTLIEQNILDLKVQEKIVSSAYIRALVRYLFETGQTFARFTAASDDILSRRVNRWNEITPINGSYILLATRQVFVTLTKQAIDDGMFQPYPCNGLVGEFNYLQDPSYRALVDWLNKEMVENND